jgi:hypothetical protein
MRGFGFRSPPANNARAKGEVDIADAAEKARHSRSEKAKNS